MDNVETNVVQTIDGHPAYQPGSESFDFGRNGVSTRRGQYRETSPCSKKPPPNKLRQLALHQPVQAERIPTGQVLQYQHDMSAVMDDLVTGYRMKLLYHAVSSMRTKLLGEIYTVPTGSGPVRERGRSCPRSFNANWTIMDKFER